MTIRKLLLIEPDKELSSMVDRFLGKSDFEVAVARDGLEGLQLASKISPHLVVIEMQLDNRPEGGLSLGKSFRGDIDLSKIPLVLMLPEDFEDERPEHMKAIEKVFDGLLYKPFADTELKRVVENFTGFGESDDTRQKQLDDLLDKRSGAGADPDSQNLVKDLKEKEAGKPAKEVKKKKAKTESKAKQKGQKPDDKDRIVSERDKRIESLLEQLSDMEMDHSFEIEAFESERDEHLKKVEELNRRVEELEHKLNEALDYIEKSRDVLKKASR